MKRTSEDESDQLEWIRRADKLGIDCREHPCKGVYVPIELYQFHVQQYHDHRCVECGKNLVTENLLNLHLEEMHNPFNSGHDVQYRCFEDSCTETFSSQQERVYHAIKVHEYPESFDFDVVRNGQSFS